MSDGARVGDIQELDEAECLRLVASQEVGRIAYNGRYGPMVLPVNYRLFEGSIVIAVWDRNPAPPVLRQSEPDSENGRGLSIVAALCKRWEYLLLDGGKCVWAELAIQPDALPSAELPRRVPASSSVRPAESRTDPALLRRVHEGLRNL